MSIRHRNNGIVKQFLSHMRTFKHCRLRTGSILCNMLTCFRSRHQRRTHLKQRHHNQNTTNRMPKGPFLSQTSGQTAIKNKKESKTYMERHTMTEIVNHSRSTVLERSVKTLLGGVGWEEVGDFNRFYEATTLALSSVVVNTRHLFSPREGFLTHQCYISENIKIKRIQK